MPQKVLKGKVVSDKMDKTIVVAVRNSSADEKYRKIIVRTKKFKAHDEKNESKIGDVVEIVENKPISKTKRWMLKSIVKKAE